MEEGESGKEEGEDGKYGKNGKEVRLGMATMEAGWARNEGGGKGISLKRRSWEEAKGRRRRSTM
jgi:hypothetical protein